jgi:hypothetical protein
MIPFPIHLSHVAILEDGPTISGVCNKQQKTGKRRFYHSLLRLFEIRTNINDRKKAENDGAAPAFSRDIENVTSMRQFFEGSVCRSLESVPDQTRR